MRRWILGLIGFLLLGLIVWRVVGRMADKGGGGPQRQPPVVSLATVERRDLEQTFEAVGSVESSHRVQLTPKVAGRIDYLTVQGGDRVRRGQILVRLDNSDLVAQVNQKQASVAEARYRLAQAKLQEGSTEAQVASALRQQEAAVTTARADANQVRQQTDAAVGAAEAALDSAEANYGNAKAKQARVQSLYDQAFTAAQDLDDARTATEVALESVKSARENVRAAEAKARVDIAAAEARLKQARAALDYARANIVQGAAYQENLAALQAVVAAAEADLQSVESRLSDTILTSPLDGWVTSRTLDPGNLAQPGTAILTVQASGELWVTVPVPEEIRPRLDVGDSASIVLDSLPGKTLKGTIVLINAAADPQNRQFTMQVRLPSESRVRPGMYAHVQVPLEKAEGALAVPRDAIQDGKYAMVVDAQNKVTRRDVKLGMQTPEWQQVTSGLQAGEKVVTLSAVPLKDGQTVRTESKK